MLDRNRDEIGEQDNNDMDTAMDGEEGMENRKNNKGKRDRGVIDNFVGYDENDLSTNVELI